MIERPMIVPFHSPYGLDAGSFTIANDIAAEAINELKNSGTAFPDVTSVIFSTKKTKSRAVRDESGSLVIDDSTGKPKRETVSIGKPRLATTVTFADGSKVTVINTENDPITFDDDGNVSRESREHGLVYAILKRLMSTYRPDANGNATLVSEGFGRKLNELVDIGYDQEKHEAARRADKEAKKAQPAPAKPKRKSLAETVDALAATVTELSKAVDIIKASKEA